MALTEPHKPVASTTTSSWLVKIVQTAYSDESMRVNTHSTRAIAASWALYKGASIKTIIEAADWASESTFVKFYLRDLDSHKYVK